MEKVTEFLTYLTTESVDAINTLYPDYHSLYVLFKEARLNGILDKISPKYQYSATGMGDYFEVQLLTGRTIRIEKHYEEGNDFYISFPE